MEGWVDLGDWLHIEMVYLSTESPTHISAQPGVKLAICCSQVCRPNHYTTKPHNHYNSHWLATSTSSRLVTSDLSQSKALNLLQKRITNIIFFPKSDCETTLIIVGIEALQTWWWTSDKELLSSKASCLRSRGCTNWQIWLKHYSLLILTGRVTVGSEYLRILLLPIFVIQININQWTAFKEKGYLLWNSERLFKTSAFFHQFLILSHPHSRYSRHLLLLRYIHCNCTG